ncbi:MAG: hypothetical protein JO000_09715 [Alphaproteobacteria bacterium]|nr:hypothetical protein [Alphaproteobacteria bacterium]
MRNILFAASALAALAIPGVASAQYYSTETYVAPPAPYLAPAPGYVVPGGPMVESQVYLAPPAVTVAPGTTYDDQAIYMNGEHYYRDCWWDWGRRRCELKRWY